MPLDLTDDMSTLVQVMAWFHQAASHYLSQCWPRSLSPHGVTKPLWVKIKHHCSSKISGVYMMMSSNRNIFRVTEFTSTDEFPAQRPVTRSFDVSLICAWINRWVNNREANDLRIVPSPSYLKRYHGKHRNDHKTMIYSNWYIIYFGHAFTPQKLRKFTPTHCFRVISHDGSVNCGSVISSKQIVGFFLQIVLRTFLRTQQLVESLVNYLAWFTWLSPSRTKKLQVTRIR